jgi:hypothetical protein
MGGHRNQVTAVFFRGIDDGSVGMLMLDSDHVARNSYCRCRIFHLIQVFGRRSARTLLVRVRGIGNRLSVDGKHMERYRDRDPGNL